MSFIPDEELKDKSGMTMTPMIDFLFLMLAVFASLAVTRAVIRDTEIDLVKSKVEIPSQVNRSKEYKLLNITVSEDGTYKWVTEVRDHILSTPQEISQELIQQYKKGILPENKLKTQVLLKIDRNAKWEPILEVILAIREAGFEVRPVYEPITHTKTADL